MALSEVCRRRGMGLIHTLLLVLISISNYSHALIFSSSPLRAIPSSQTEFDAVGILVISWGDPSAEGLRRDIHEDSCSGAIVTLDPANVDPAAPALVLTNGHCAEPGTLLSPGERWREFLPPSETYFWPGPGVRRRFAPIRVRGVRYASMTEADVALLTLDITYGQLARLGIQPLQLGTPRLGAEVRLVGVPVAGMPARRHRLHESRCRLETRTTVFQERGVLLGGTQSVQRYEWPHSFLHRCSMVGGNSGSPMIDVESGKVVAVNNSEVLPSCQPSCSADGQKPNLSFNVAQGLDSIRR
jgi:hypothetical protein